MRKKLLISLFTALMLLTLSSCKKAEQKVTVTLWHTFTAGQEELLETIIKEFNDSHADISVVAVSQPNDGFTPKIHDALASQTGPDIVFDYASTATDYMDAGQIVDISTYMTTDYKSRVSDGVYEESTGFSVGQLYAVAIQSTGPVYFYNKTVFDELGLSAPADWDDVETAAKAIYAAYGIPGFGFGTSLVDGFQTLLIQSGGQYVDLDQKSVSFDTPEFVQWVEWFAKGVQAGYFSLKPVTGDYFSDDMSGKVLASYAGSCASLPYLDLGEDELAAVPLPVVAGGTTWVPAWNRSALVFSSNEAEERAAVKFVEYFTSEKNSVRWAESVVAFTPYKDAAESAAYKRFLEGNIALTALSQQIDYAYALPNFPGASTVRDEIAALVEKAASGQMSAQEAVDEAAVTCNAAMQGE